MKKPKLKLQKYDLVHIEWFDSVSEEPAWQPDSDDDLLPAACFTTGYILQGWNKNAKFMKVCGSISEDTVLNKVAFPKGVIKCTKLLMRKKPDSLEWFTV